MSRTLRNSSHGLKVHDGNSISNVCTVKTDGERIKPMKWECDEAQYYNSSFKKELKREASKKVRQISKRNIQSEIDED